MVSSNCNPNYELFVIENIPEGLFFPNFVIMKSMSRKRMFISFRSDDSSGSFAFSTSNDEFINGILNYCIVLARTAEPAKDALKRWSDDKN